MQVQPIPNPSFLTPQQLAKRWHLSTKTLWRMRRDNKIKAHIIGARAVRFAVEDVLKLENQS
jgi:excisionase family DNA binding protein